LMRHVTKTATATAGARGWVEKVGHGDMS